MEEKESPLKSSIFFLSKLRNFKDGMGETEFLVQMNIIVIFYAMLFFPLKAQKKIIYLL